MESGAALRYTGTRPRRRSLESLIKGAALHSNSVDTTTRHSGDDAEQNSSDPSSSSLTESSSSSLSSEESSEPLTEQSSTTEIVVEPSPTPQTAPFFNEDMLDKEFHSAFLPANETPSSSPRTFPSIDDVYTQLQTVIADLGIIKRQLETEHNEQTEKKASEIGQMAVKLGREAVTGFQRRFAPSHQAFKHEHSQQLSMLDKMRAAVNLKDSGETLHSVYGGCSRSSVATTSFLSPSLNARRTLSAKQGDEVSCARDEMSVPSHAPSEADPMSGGSRKPCRHCGRLMLPKALAHHENICIRIFHGRKRTTYAPS